MDKITPELRERFIRFHEVYEFTHARLKAEGAGGAVIAETVWRAALDEVPLTPDELRTYKLHIAMQSVNGGQLFATDEPENR